MNVLKISKKLPVLRFYSWVWKTKPEKISICKLFWGIIFTPYGLLLPKEEYGVWRVISCLLSIFLLPGILKNMYLGLWKVAILGVILIFSLVVAGYIADKIFSSRLYAETIVSFWSKSKKTFWFSILRQMFGIFWFLPCKIGSFIEFLLYKILDITDDVRYSRFSRILSNRRPKTDSPVRIKGFLGMIWVYFWATKKRFCPIIEVVE